MARARETRRQNLPSAEASGNGRANYKVTSSAASQRRLRLGETRRSSTVVSVCPVKDRPRVVMSMLLHGKKRACVWVVSPDAAGLVCRGVAWRRRGPCPCTTTSPGIPTARNRGHKRRLSAETQRMVGALTRTVVCDCGILRLALA